MIYKIITILVLSLSIFQTLHAQFISVSPNVFIAQIKDEETEEPLIGVTVTVSGTSLGAVSDTDGNIRIENVPDGAQKIIFRSLGYETLDRVFTFPMPEGSMPVEIELEPEEETLDEVVVQSTRGTRTFANIPTRVEFISGEELDEKGSMKPGDIRMLLNESTGIITQQTSATSGNAAIRIQGLDGRYTQILKDGFPVFAGAASGLGLLQTPPLDLKQVEIIKGSTSTLYGGGAIAGLINLISKTPSEKRELSMHLNVTSGKGLDVSGFYGQKFRKVGTTVFAAYNHNGAYDPSDVGFTAIPKFNRFVLNPTLYLYLTSNTTLRFGINAMVENRLGGDMAYVKGHGDDTHRYFEENKTRRYSTQLTLDHKWEGGAFLSFKNSISYFDRDLSVPDYQFDGSQWSTFSEVAYTQPAEECEWVGGLNLWTENFNEKRFSDFPLRNYRRVIGGIFGQNTWEASEKLSLETGLRADWVNAYGIVLLPRISGHFKFNPHFSSRLGGGLGYKSPTIFTEESERIEYEGVLPIDRRYNRLEKSYGLNWDVNYKTSLFDGKVFLNVNQLFFLSWLDNPLMLRTIDGEPGNYRLVNIAGHTLSKGSETNVKVSYHDFHLYLGYTFTDLYTKEGGHKEQNILTPKHRLNSILMYEVEDEWKIGLEAYYFSRQKLGDGLTGKAYVVCGFMIEKIWEHFSVYANFENFTDRRQTRFDTIYTGSISNPVFRDIYAPLDGFVMNCGVKISF
ncbi:MAG: TonB-dependent receptor [Duncaniella sp.]|nr:TonB-dependent receptor [Duncaniella sp.]